MKAKMGKNEIENGDRILRSFISVSFATNCIVDAKQHHYHLTHFVLTSSMVTG